MQQRDELGYDIAMLTAYARAHGLIEEQDAVWAANRLAEAMGRPDCPLWSGPLDPLPQWPQTLLDRLTDRAAAGGALDTTARRDRFDTELMAALLPRPSEVTARFRALYAESPARATDWFYDFSRASNYIRAERCAKDLHWSVGSPYGEILISVNLSKPEKDPRDIAAARSAPKTAYPACALCRENEGFGGTAASAPRGSHRVIPLELGGETWYLQYSPYVYYNEHCIVLSGEHRPMKTDRSTFVRLLEFVGRFPHYFVGSNADLPIVGGSILSHDHFQGGRAAFPMESAPVTASFRAADFPAVRVDAIRWPLSVLRLSSADPEALAGLADRILGAWRGYSDESLGILAESDGAPHNAVTPIARRKDGRNELDLVLRNNRCTEERPLGLFHPAPSRHHIKKENIGLIEVMGLAVLPSRLSAELAAVEACLTGDRASFYDRPELAPHEAWYRALCARTDVPPEAWGAVLREETGKIFVGCLEDCGVFRNDPAGQAGLARFAQSAGLAPAR